jgi:3-oxoacyl-[acyl-carrier protein] reductase
VRALVTGASRGIGKAVADLLEARGNDVFRASRSTGFDLMDSTTALVDRLGYADIIVHNAGGALGITDPWCSASDWYKVYRLNMGAAVEINRALIPDMQRRGWGRVVHISSISALENQGTVPYCSVKAALNAYTRSLGRLVSADGVCVSAVMPGAVFTEGGYWDHPRAEKFAKERMACQRLGTVDEIASLVGFLCSHDASFVAGSAFLVDGGQGRVFQ